MLEITLALHLVAEKLFPVRNHAPVTNHALTDVRMTANLTTVLLKVIVDQVFHVAIRLVIQRPYL